MTLVRVKYYLNTLLKYREIWAKYFMISPYVSLEMHVAGHWLESVI